MIECSQGLVPSSKKSDTMARNRYPRQTAFTLIELMVVVSIIALLLSILLPSMRRAREQAKLVVCQSNLRQIVVGFFGYANDHDDSAPVAAPHELGGATGCVQIDDPWQPARMFGGCIEAEKRPLNPYLGNAHEVFRCPADKGEPIWWIEGEPPEASRSAYKVYGSSYIVGIWEIDE
ncbi:MAG: prepilin-type N-terminal cleavage/methylation domain-containing protein [Phycisphaerae bacterium]|nr:prepilin-type N-terminal cleavage/methylation domain-containing protein [Phycisphaerae bacterium]